MTPEETNKMINDNNYPTIDEDTDKIFAFFVFAIIFAALTAMAIFLPAHVTLSVVVFLLCWVIYTTAKERDMWKKKALQNKMKIRTPEPYSPWGERGDAEAAAMESMSLHNPTLTIVGVEILEDGGAVFEVLQKNGYQIIGKGETK